MKIKTGRIVAALARSIRESGLLAVLGILLCAGQAQGQQLPEAATLISPRVKSFIGERWNSNSFPRGLQIVSDANETPISRTAALELLHANRRKLSPTEMENLLSEAARTAKDPSLDETNSSFAVSIMANLALTLKDQGQISEAASKQEAGFLIATATDARRNVQLRASAIVALGILKVTREEAHGMAFRLLPGNRGVRASMKRWRNSSGVEQHYWSC